MISESKQTSGFIKHLLTLLPCLRLNVKYIAECLEKYFLNGEEIGHLLKDRRNTEGRNMRVH